MKEKMVEEIVAILENSESKLSDGYGYYCGWKNVDKVLHKIVEEIVDGIGKIREERLPEISHFSLGWPVRQDYVGKILHEKVEEIVDIIRKIKGGDNGRGYRG